MRSRRIARRVALVAACATSVATSDYSLEGPTATTGREVDVAGNPLAAEGRARVVVEGVVDADGRFRFEGEGCRGDEFADIDDVYVELAVPAEVEDARLLWTGGDPCAGAETGGATGLRFEVERGVPFRWVAELPSGLEGAVSATVSVHGDRRGEDVDVDDIDIDASIGAYTVSCGPDDTGDSG